MPNDKGIIVKGGKVFTPNGFVENGAVAIEGGRIAAIGRLEEFGTGPEGYGQTVVSRDDLIVPGFVDIHIHGARGCDTMDASIDALNTISLALAEKGTTSFLATTMTTPPEALKKAVQAVGEAGHCAGANLLGAHLEGPFISEKYKGVQNPENIQKPDVDLMLELLELSNNRVRLVSLAPEQPGAQDVIKLLRKRDVTVSVGHSDATYDHLVEAVNLGLSHATHTYNGMRGFNHRSPGALGAVLTIDSIDCEIIADLKHVHPAGIKLLLAAKGADRVILISDAIRAAMMPDGNYELGGLDIRVIDGDARMQNGNLAGTTIMIIDAIKNMVTRVGISLSDALRMATINPARSINVDDRKGSLVVGKDGDLTILSKDLHVKKTIVMGRPVFDRDVHVRDISG